jgi:Carboxylesterase family
MIPYWGELQLERLACVAGGDKKMPSPMHSGHPFELAAAQAAARALRQLVPGLAGCAAALVIGAAQAAPPAAIEAGLHRIDRVVDPICTARLYRPLMPERDITSNVAQPYPGVTVTRNQSFGPDPKDVIDIFAADRGARTRSVLIFIPGGAGNKIEIQSRADNAFYDNIGRWATEHGMVGVLMQRKASRSWDGGAQDIAAMLRWVAGHIRTYHGDPNRIVLWAHSAGNMPMGTYLGHPERFGPKGIAIRGVIFMSAASFDIAPVKPPRMGRDALLGDPTHACGVQGGMAAEFGAEGALPGVPAGGPGGPPLRGAQGAARPPGGAPPDAATELARSSLPALRKAPYKIMIVNGELDPEPLVAFGVALHDALCEAGPAHCPERLIAQGESHMSLVFSIDSPDTTVSTPVLAFIRRARAAP